MAAYLDTFQCACSWTRVVSFIALVRVCANTHSTTPNMEPRFAGLCCPHTEQDICKPDPARLRRNLSAIINFAKFREEKLAPYAEAQEEADALLDEAARLEDQNARLVRLIGRAPITGVLQMGTMLERCAFMTVTVLQPVSLPGPPALMAGLRSRMRAECSAWCFLPWRL